MPKPGRPPSTVEYQRRAGLISLSKALDWLNAPIPFPTLHLVSPLRQLRIAGDRGRPFHVIGVQRE